ncbi:MAG: hypothetical protein ABL919_04835, partial [Methylococcales bacterium]
TSKNLTLFLTQNPLLVIPGYHLKLLSGFRGPLYFMPIAKSINCHIDGLAVATLSIEFLYHSFCD